MASQYLFGAFALLQLATAAPYASTSNPVTVQSFENYKYIGCYTDSSSARFLQGASHIDYTAMTVEKCGKLAAAGGWTYFGLECYGVILSIVI